MIFIDLGKLGKVKLQRLTPLEVVGLLALLGFAVFIVLIR